MMYLTKFKTNFSVLVKGNYMNLTSINLTFELSKDCPKDVLDIMYYIITNDKKFIREVNLPNHKFFKDKYWWLIGTGSSIHYIHDGFSHIKRNEIEYDYSVFIKSAIRSSSNAYTLFLDWIKPYLVEIQNLFLGYIYDEDNDVVQFIYFEDKGIRYKQIST